MKCSKCPYYKSNPTWNRCEVTDSECFYITEDCIFVNDDGTLNKEEYEKIFG
jgi:hypothetical protein